MADEIQVYDHPVLSDHARRLLVVVAAVAALVLGLVSPAAAADGHIAGTITGQGAGPLAGAWVDVYDFNTQSYVASDETDAQGGYDVTVPPGTFLLVFYTPDNSYQAEYYDDVRDFAIEDATPVVVASGGSIHADAELSAYASIAGHVTASLDEPDGSVLVYNDRGRLVRRTHLEVDGSYRIGSLRNGTYRVAFNRLSGFAYAAAEFYDDHAEGAGLDAAETITLTDGQAATGVNAVLTEGGHITGTLRDNDGNALRCRLQAFTAKRKRLVTRTGWSNPSSGAFDIAGLSTGSYLVRVVNGNGCRNGIQYVDGTGGALTAQSSGADPVAVTVGDDTALAPALVYDLGLQPANVVPPSVTGSPVVGSTLTADRGTWTASSHLAYHYQWLAAGAELPGATGRSYVPTQADLGKTIAVRVTATRGPSRSAVATSAPTAAVQAAAAPTPPAIVNLQSPSSMGPARVRVEVLALSGRWSVPDATFRYIWSSGSTVWQDSANRRFTAPDAAYKLPMTLTVVASRPGYVDGVASVSAGPVGKGFFRSKRPPQLDGRMTVGSTLVVTPGTYSPKPTRVTYTWRRDGKIIPRAKGDSYTLTRADVGHRIQVHVLVGRKLYEPETFYTPNRGPVTR